MNDKVEPETSVPINVLIVDDRADGLIAMEAVLQGLGYNLVKATSGEEALRCFLRDDFAMVLLDVQMPGMNGFQTATLMHRNQGQRKTPIIFVTAINLEEHHVHIGYETGAVDYLFKPFDSVELRAKVAVFAKMYQLNTKLMRQNEHILALERKEHKQHVAELELESLRSYQVLADAGPHIIWKAKTNGSIFYLNRVWPEYTGMGIVESYGKNWQAAIYHADQEPLLSAWTVNSCLNRPFEIEARLYRRQDDTFRWNMIRVVPEAGRSDVWIGTATDIHERHQVFELEQSAKIAAEMANEAKSRFLANMSHEIRTPLSAILGYAELLATSANPPQSVLSNSVSRIRKNVEHLMELIDEILDIAKIEAGKLEVERVSFALIPELAEAFAILQSCADSKGLRLGVIFYGEIPETVTTSPKRLRQILINIVGNALKFTAQGSVVVSVRLEPSNDGVQSGKDLCFTVTDTGRGLSYEQQQRIFRPFVQADCSVTREFGGSGLGLVLSQRLAESLGGRVGLEESHLGKGSTFTVRIDPGSLEEVRMLKDLTKQDMDLSVKEVTVSDQFVASQNLSGLRVLLAEDGPDLQLLVKHFLEASGATVEVASNGVEVVEKVQTRSYDIVLMDIQMPILDGYEATKRLRAKGVTTPIIALTAHSMRGEREKCIAAGCDEYVSKPIKPVTLVSVVEAIVTKSPRTSSGRSLLEGDPIVGPLLPAFLNNLSKHMVALRDAYSRLDWQELNSLGHKMAGSAGSYGFPELGRISAEIELQAKSQCHGDLAQSIAIFDSLCERARSHSSCGP